jgi:arylsulfatase A-like enzyme
MKNKQPFMKFGLPGKWHALFSIALIPILCGAIHAKSEASDTPPNIIFILTDDQGWGDLGIYGHQWMKTPNIDQLAREGALLTDFYIMSPVCSPSRASFMTGRYPIEVGLPHIVMEGKRAEQFGTSPYLDPKYPTYTRFFQERGYRVGQFGKWHLGFKDGPPIADYGIDESLTAHGNGPQFPLYDRPANDEERREFRARSTELIIDASIDFIERNKDQPFLVNVWTIIPHSPMVPTEEQLSVYPQLNQPRFIPHISSRQIYYAMMTDLDKHVGRLLTRLDELGLSENTIIIFSSDNGPEHQLINNAGYSASGSTGPFRGYKRSLYDGGIRVPFIARWPLRIPAGFVSNDVVSGIDFFPTIASMAGFGLPDGLGIRGEDRSIILLGGSRPRQSPIFWEWRSQVYAEPIHHSPRLALRDEDYKFLMNPDGSRKELYNVRKDFLEINNLVEQKPDLVEKYSRMLLNFEKAMPPGPVQPGAGEQNFRLPVSR